MARPRLIRMKDGETGVVDGIRVQCVRTEVPPACGRCALKGRNVCTRMACAAGQRSDRQDVHFEDAQYSSLLTKAVLADRLRRLLASLEASAVPGDTQVEVPEHLELYTKAVGYSIHEEGKEAQHRLVLSKEGI